MSKCFLVGTPIGNLDDITYRAVATLALVDVIASEDTRHTRILLDKYNIKKPLISYYKQKENEGAEEIVALLKSGKNVALVTDAGMPAISDPGAVLVRKLREEGCEISVVPGPTAVSSAVSLAGLVASGFCFVGFLPDKKKERDAIINRLKDNGLPLVFYVAPHDITDTLGYLYQQLGSRKVYVVKEITKIHETVYEGKLGDVVVENLKGEFVVIVDAVTDKPTVDMTELIQYVEEEIKNGTSTKDAVKKIAMRYDVAKNELYAAYHKD